MKVVKWFLCVTIVLFAGYGVKSFFFPKRPPNLYTDQQKEEIKEIFGDVELDVDADENGTSPLFAPVKFGADSDVSSTIPSSLSGLPPEIAAVVSPFAPAPAAAIPAPVVGSEFQEKPALPEVPALNSPASDLPPSPFAFPESPASKQVTETPAVPDVPTVPDAPDSQSPLSSAPTLPSPFAPLDTGNAPSQSTEPPKPTESAQAVQAQNSAVQEKVKPLPMVVDYASALANNAKLSKPDRPESVIPEPFVPEPVAPALVPTDYQLMVSREKTVCEVDVQKQPTSPKLPDLPGFSSSSADPIVASSHRDSTLDTKIDPAANNFAQSSLSPQIAPIAFSTHSFDSSQRSLNSLSFDTALPTRSVEPIAPQAVAVPTVQHVPISPSIAGIPVEPAVVQPAENTQTVPATPAHLLSQPGHREPESVLQQPTVAAVATRPVVRESVVKYVKSQCALIDSGMLRSVCEGYDRLSQLYDHKDLTPDERSYIAPILDQLAGDVIFEPEIHILELKYTVGRFETVESIAAQFDLNPETLMRMNGMSAPHALVPGKELKVVRGPFDARISRSRQELQVILGGLYVRAYKIAIDESYSAREGEFLVQEKADAAATRPGKWIGIGGGKGLLGVEEITQANPTGAILLSAGDMQELYSLLNEKSTITIVK